MTMASHHEEVSCMNMHRRRSRQRGLSFYGLVFILVLLLAGVVIGGQSVPIFIEYLSAKRAIEKAKLAGPADAVRADFDRTAQVNDIRSIKSEDLENTEHRGNAGGTL